MKYCFETELKLKIKELCMQGTVAKLEKSILKENQKGMIKSIKSKSRKRYDSLNDQELSGEFLELFGNKSEKELVPFMTWEEYINYGPICEKILKGS
ncbi:hypothetical protein HOK00_11330 [bacterium]|jgi:hypothetical protein|nr:hypothetical protein [bacterium]